MYSLLTPVGHLQQDKLVETSLGEQGMAQIHALMHCFHLASKTVYHSIHFFLRKLEKCFHWPLAQCLFPSSTTISGTHLHFSPKDCVRRNKGRVERHSEMFQIP